MSLSCSFHPSLSLSADSSPPASPFIARSADAGTSLSVPRRRFAGLTLVEMLVAVAAFTLIALGLAQVFAASGNTLRAGRRISRLTEYSAAIERQFRHDIENMSRNGFLVIRHRLAADGASILLWQDDPTVGRPRRVDEICFFREGSFISMRDPLNPARQASGPAARIYFGHGLRYDPDLDEFRDAPRADRPRFGDNVIQPTFGQIGPNLYASDWILLRHLTVLTGASHSALKPKPQGLSSDPYPDADTQADWQPAASSIFRFEAETFPETADLLATALSVRGSASETRPVFASGVVDVATTDLIEIKNTILDSRPIRLVDGSGPATADASRRLDRDEDQESVDSPRIFWARAGQSPGPLDNPNMDFGGRRQQAWMADALPADSDSQPERRIRCEPVPPDLIGTLGASGAPGLPFASAQESWRRTDQTMLASSNFVPRCTEFIVEWSFGKVYPDNFPQISLRGQLIWHGLPRAIGSGVADTRPYLDPDYDAELKAAQQINHIDSQGQDTGDSVSSFSIHYLPPNVREAFTLYSCFGYLDPTYDPFSTSFGAGYQFSNEWRWPKLLRITISLADTQEPGVEETFEYVFEIPQRLQR